MNNTATLIEYGAPIDAQAMVTPPDATELELEPGHPGLGDDGYVRRRKELFALCRNHRLEGLGPPLIDYTPEETRIWREVSPKLDELHVKHASRIYLDGQARAGHHAATKSRNSRLLSERLRRETNMHLVPAEGALPYRTFYEYIADRGFPGDAVHPPRLAPGVHARAGHDPRLPRPRPAADEPRLRRAAHADRQGRGRHDATAIRCWP